MGPNSRDYGNIIKHPVWILLCMHIDTPAKVNIIMQVTGDLNVSGLSESCWMTHDVTCSSSSTLLACGVHVCMLYMHVIRTCRTILPSHQPCMLDSSSLELG